MADPRHDRHLGNVCAAKDPAEVAAAYDKWADTYDAEMAQAGYRHPSGCLALFARYLPKGAAPLLDAGVGTGMIGDWPGIVGYPDVEGLDISEDMLVPKQCLQALRSSCYFGLVLARCARTAHPTGGWRGAPYDQVFRKSIRALLKASEWLRLKPCGASSMTTSSLPSMA